MKDTIDIVIDTLKVVQKDYGLELINRVDQYYQSAWDNIKYTLLVISTLAAWFFLYFQKKEFKEKELNIKKELDDKFKELEKLIKNQLDNELKKELEQLENKIIKKTEFAEAGVFFLQGNFFLEKEDFELATISFSNSIFSILKSTKYRNLDKAFDLLIKSIDNIKAENFKQSQSFEKVNELIEELNKNNENGIFSDKISILGEKLKEKK